MNREVLKQFQLMAGGSHYPDINPEIQAKFAELIVRECAKIANTAEPYKANDLILKHFGVE